MYYILKTTILPNFLLEFGYNQSVIIWKEKWCSIFCKIVNKEILSKILLEDEKFLTFLRYKSYKKSSCSSYSKAHYNSFEDAPDSIMIQIE